MDNTSNQSTTNIPPVQSSPAAPAPTPPSAPTPAPSEPTGTPPLSTTPPTPSISTDGKKPFPLKWALVGIGVIVVLTGSILGILGANNKQTAYTTDTKAAGKAVKTPLADNGRGNWPYATLPNVMLEKDTLRIDTDEASGEMSIHGQIVFADFPPANTGAECWVVWASTTPDGKTKNRVGTPFPKGSDQLNPPNPPCPRPGGFVAGSGYPARATRIYAPKPSENEGVLNNPNATPLRYFDIYKVKIPAGVKDKCTLYLNYRSNRQGGNATGNNSPMFFQITLPECLPTATPPQATPTMPKGRIPSPTPEVVNVPPGCSVISKFEATNGSDNWGTCDETCGLTKDNRLCAPSVQNRNSCVKQACRAGLNNQQKVKQGSWFCCTRGKCDMSCTSNNDCAGLRCVGGRCKDTSNCAASGSCKCISADVPATPTPEPTELP